MNPWSHVGFCGNGSHTSSVFNPSKLSQPSLSLSIYPTCLGNSKVLSTFWMANSSEWVCCRCEGISLMNGSLSSNRGPGLCWHLIAGSTWITLISGWAGDQKKLSQSSVSEANKFKHDLRGFISRSLLHCQSATSSIIPLSHFFLSFSLSHLIAPHLYDCLTLAPGSLLVP